MPRNNPDVQLSLFDLDTLETKPAKPVATDKLPLPLVIADRWGFALQRHVINGVYWFSIQDWLRGVMQKEDVRMNVPNARNNSSHAGCKKLPYLVGGKTYQMDYTTSNGLRDITYGMRSGTGIRNLVIGGFYRVFTDRDDSTKETSALLSHTGFVYLVQSPSGAFKIGRTKNPDNRMATFNVKLPFEVEFVALIPADNTHSLERQLHARYADKRVNGEWFNLAPDDVEYIKSLVGGE